MHFSGAIRHPKWTILHIHTEGRIFIPLQWHPYCRDRLFTGFRMHTSLHHSDKCLNTCDGVEVRGCEHRREQPCNFWGYWQLLTCLNKSHSGDCNKSKLYGICFPLILGTLLRQKYGWFLPAVKAMHRERSLAAARLPWQHQ
jgi:hypothetical protein